MIEYDALDGHDATEADLDQFVHLVQQGGAVEEEYVRQGIRREGAKIVMARSGGSIVGVAALKVPLKSYRQGIEGEAKSGHPIPEDLYPFELGYVAVSQSQSGQGIGGALVRKVLKLSSGHGLFATTSNPAMKGSILPASGFETVGTTWTNSKNESLYLFVLQS